MSANVTLRATTNVVSVIDSSGSRFVIWRIRTTRRSNCCLSMSMESIGVGVMKEKLPTKLGGDGYRVFASLH